MNQIYKIIESNSLTFLIKNETGEVFSISTEYNGEIWFKLNEKSTSFDINIDSFNLKLFSVFKNFITNLKTCQIYRQNSAIIYDDNLFNSLNESVRNSENYKNFFKNNELVFISDNKNLAKLIIKEINNKIILSFIKKNIDSISQIKKDPINVAIFHDSLIHQDVFLLFEVLLNELEQLSYIKEKVYQKK